MSQAGVIRSFELPDLGAFRGLVNAMIGLFALFCLWWLGGWYVEQSDDMFAFAQFAPVPALSRLWEMILSGEVWTMSIPSLYRVGLGLLYAIVIGVPLGIAIGRMPIFREITNVPFQFLRMISPLSWMPIAVMAFATWDGAIIFLIAVAAVWPIMFSTAAGVRRLDCLRFPLTF